MIVQREVDGRPATVVFLNTQFNPVDEKDAELVKVIFDDGEIWFLTNSPEKPTKQ